MKNDLPQALPLPPRVGKSNPTGSEVSSLATVKLDTGELTPPKTLTRRELREARSTVEPNVQASTEGKAVEDAAASTKKGKHTKNPKKVSFDELISEAVASIEEGPVYYEEAIPEKNRILARIGFGGTLLLGAGLCGWAAANYMGLL